MPQEGIQSSRSLGTLSVPDGVMRRCVKSGTSGKAAHFYPSSNLSQRAWMQLSEVEVQEYRIELSK